MECPSIEKKERKSPREIFETNKTVRNIYLLQEKFPFHNFYEKMKYYYHDLKEEGAFNGHLKNILLN